MLAGADVCNDSLSDELNMRLTLASECPDRTGLYRGHAKLRELSQSLCRMPRSRAIGFDGRFRSPVHPLEKISATSPLAEGFSS